MIDVFLHIDIFIIMHTGDNVIVLIIGKKSDIQLSCKPEQIRHKLRRKCLLIDHLIRTAVRDLSSVKRKNISSVFPEV